MLLKINGNLVKADERVVVEPKRKRHACIVGTTVSLRLPFHSSARAAFQI